MTPTRRAFISNLFAAPAILSLGGTEVRAGDSSQAALESPSTVTYPPALTLAGYPNWMCLFNPDLTKAPSSLVGSTAISTPLTYDWPLEPAYGGNAYNTSMRASTMSQGVNGIVTTVTGSGGTWQGIRMNTLDRNNNGRVFVPPFYCEVVMSPAYENYNVDAFAGLFSRHNSVLNPGAYPFAEFDIFEQVGTASQFQTNATAHSNSNGVAPFGANQSTTPGTQTLPFNVWAPETKFAALYVTSASQSPTFNALINSKLPYLFWFAGDQLTISAPAWSTWANISAAGFWLDIYQSAGSFVGLPPASGSFTWTLNSVRVWAPTSASMVNLGSTTPYSNGGVQYA